MVIRILPVVLFLWCLSRHHGAEGRQLSIEEDMEIEKRLKQLNKPAVATIKTTDGDTYNCVDFYEQPAFDHPDLKDRKFEYKMKPTIKRLSHSEGSMWVNGYGCPEGTVPIRQYTKDDLVHAKLAADMYSPRSKYSPNSDDFPGIHASVLRTRDPPKTRYKGGRFITSIYNPKVVDLGVSSSHMKFQTGPEVIEVGWTVNTVLYYRDNRTRFYIYTRNNRTTSCFNLECNGFILNNPMVPIDTPLKTSQRGGVTYVYGFFIYKDVATGDWILKFGLNNEIEVGRWPQKFYTYLSDTAAYIQWGGQVLTPINVGSPEMGSGNGPPLSLNTRFDCFCYSITAIDQNNNQINPDDTEVFSDIGDVYPVKDVGLQGKLGRVILFGGRGGYVGN